MNGHAGILVSRKCHIKVINTQFKVQKSILAVKVVPAVGLEALAGRFWPRALCLAPLISSKCCINLTWAGVLIDV